MIERHKERLLRLAKANPGVRGKFKMAAGVVNRKGILVATGINSYKTHPIMANGTYREEQIYLHAEAHAIINGLKTVNGDSLDGCKLYVVRVKKDTRGEYQEALAKPCTGCMALISEVGIKEVEWTYG